MPCLKCSKPVYESKMCRSHFTNYFEKKVRKTIRKYDLFKRKDKIGVAVSGGKDSTVALYLLHKMGYNVMGITVDAVIGNYTKENLTNLQEFCDKHEIPLKIISFREEFGHSLCYIRDTLKSKGKDFSSCLICGVLRRFLLNKYAKDLSLDYIATGHNLDDEVQAFLMNVFRNDTKLVLRQGPKSGVTERKGFVRRVKPLYLCTEKEVIAYSKLMKFKVKYEQCPCSVGAFRREFREFLDSYEKKHPSVKHNIENFYLDMIYPMKKTVSGAPRVCELCGEPSSKKICKKCQILVSLRK